MNMTYFLFKCVHLFLAKVQVGHTSSSFSKLPVSKDSEPLLISKSPREVNVLGKKTTIYQTLPQPIQKYPSSGGHCVCFLVFSWWFLVMTQLFPSGPGQMCWLNFELMTCPWCLGRGHGLDLPPPRCNRHQHVYYMFSRRTQENYKPSALWLASWVGGVVELPMAFLG